MTHEKQIVPGIPKSVTETWPSATETRDAASAVEAAARRAKRSARLSKLTMGLLGRDKQLSEPHAEAEAPLGYNDMGEPKKITRMTRIDPTGKEPNKTIHLKNW